MTGHGALVNRGGSLTDRYRVLDPSVILRLLRMVARAAHPTGTPQILQQLFFQGAAGLELQRRLKGFLSFPGKGFEVGFLASVKG